MLRLTLKNANPADVAIAAKYVLRLLRLISHVMSRLGLNLPYASQKLARSARSPEVSNGFKKAQYFVREITGTLLIATQ